MRTILYCLILFLGACTKKEDFAYKHCGYNVNEARLLKKVTTTFQPTYKAENTENFIYDKKGRLDSIYIVLKNLNYPSITQSSIRYIYNENNLLTEERHYNLTYNYFTHYIYEYDSKGKLIKQYSGGTSQDHFLQYTFKTDELGRIQSYKHQLADDTNVITYNDCSNPIKHQAFYDKDGQEHYLSVTEFSEVLNPLYSKNMPSFSYLSNPHLMANSEIIHWDCADYIGGKLLNEYETNSLNLPLKSKQYYKGGDVISVSEYFY